MERDCLSLDLAMNWSAQPFLPRSLRMASSMTPWLMGDSPMIAPPVSSCSRARRSRCAFTSQGVGLIEEQDPAAPGGLLEHPRQVLQLSPLKSVPSNDSLPSPRLIRLPDEVEGAAMGEAAAASAGSAVLGRRRQGGEGSVIGSRGHLLGWR
jgi:hypothetical protein